MNHFAASGRTRNNRVGNLSIAPLEDLPDNPPSRGGTELLNPSTPLTPYPSRLSRLTLYPSLLSAHGNPGYRYTSSWLPISSRTISFLVTRSVGVMR